MEDDARILEVWLAYHHWVEYGAVPTALRISSRMKPMNFIGAVARGDVRLCLYPMLVRPGMVVVAVGWAKGRKPACITVRRECLDPYWLAEYVCPSALVR